jgi:hypothetical protein
MSAQLEEFNSECFDSAGEFLGTDGCYGWAEEHIELENLLESIEKGCVLSDMSKEDYSCKGPSAPSHPTVREQGNSAEVSEQDTSDYFVVDVSEESGVSEQEIQALHLLGFFGEYRDEGEKLYSPEYWHGQLIS